MRNFIGIVIILFATCSLLLSSCKKEGTNVVKIDTNPEKTPTINSKNVTTLISDSGITRYKISTKDWLMFENAKEPFWKFPHGLKVEKFDTLFYVDASIVADSATYFKNSQLWRLDGDVEIKTASKEEFYTSQIFWDQRAQKIYSDSFIHIRKADKVIEGYGFVSNEKMTTYVINKTSGIFPYQQAPPGAGASNGGRAKVDTARTAIDSTRHRTRFKALI